MDAAGMRGVRFNFLPRLVDATPREVHSRVAERVAALGWHIVVYFEAPSLAEHDRRFSKALPTTIVLDHMSLPDAKKGVDHPDFQAYLQLLAEHPNIWVKVTGPERISRQGPPYDDVVPFARALVERFPDRVLWGTDWPHPNMTTHMPDDGVLVDMIPEIRADRGAAEGAAGRQSDAALLGEMRLAEKHRSLRGHSRHARLRRQALAPGLSSQHVLHVADEATRTARRSRPTRRNYLDSFPMSPEQRKAILERDWNEMLRLGGNIYYTSKLGGDRRPDLPEHRRDHDRLDPGGIRQDDARGRPVARRQSQQDRNGRTDG